MNKLFKILMSVLILSLTSTNAFAKIKKHKKVTRKHEHSSRVSRKTKHSKRNKHKVHHGTGPDLKEITTNSPYSSYNEEPKNGVNSVETKTP